MAETDMRAARAQHARRQALLQPVNQLAGKQLQQPQIDLSRNDRDSFKQPSCWAR